MNIDFDWCIYDSITVQTRYSIFVRLTFIIASLAKCMECINPVNDNSLLYTGNQQRNGLKTILQVVYPTHSSTLGKKPFDIEIHVIFR